MAHEPVLEGGLQGAAETASTSRLREASEQGPAATPAVRLWRDVSESDEPAEPVFQALTPAQAAALRARQPLVSPWRVVGLQAGSGLVIAAAMLLLTSPLNWVGSFLYGTAAVVFPGALMAWGISRPRASQQAGAGLASFMVWEAAKVGLSVVMLLLAPLLHPGLAWPALLAGMLVCMKCYWAALLWRGSNKN